MLELLEFEEQVGRVWHRLIGGQATYPHFPEHAVELETIRNGLAVFFRGAGGDPALELAAGGAEASSHRLRLRQRLGLDQERLERPARTSERVLLPAVIDCLPDAASNRDLYLWLAAFLALHDADALRPTDPLQTDLVFLRAARRTSQRVLEAFPGLSSRYCRLCRHVLAVRPDRELPRIEAALEAAIRALLGDSVPEQTIAQAMLRAIQDGEVGEFAAPRGYRPFLPVPLFGDVRHEQTSGQREATQGRASPPGDRPQEREGRHRRARRRRLDQTRRKDPLILFNKGELLKLADGIADLARAREDEDDPDAARRAADDSDELALSGETGATATRLRIDVDLPPPETGTAPLVAELTYPEWSYRHRTWLPDHCRIRVEVAPSEGEHWEPDQAARRRIRQVRRRFEALRPKREILRGQLDGSELDTDALVREQADLAAQGSASERIYLDVRNQARSLAALILVDLSLSTDAWVGQRRVLDVEKEALTVLTHGLAGLGDAFAILGFSSNTRHDVKITEIKRFTDRVDGSVLKRISALRPGHYTRMGAAIRHAQTLLAARPEHHRLLFVLTDGKPNDFDHYEGRHGIEDTRCAILEARRAGSAVFAATIDDGAQAYLPFLFGRGGYVRVLDVDRLPAALPAIYRQLTT